MIYLVAYGGLDLSGFACRIYTTINTYQRQAMEAQGKIVRLETSNFFLSFGYVILTENHKGWGRYGSKEKGRSGVRK